MADKIMVTFDALRSPSGEPFEGAIAWIKGIVKDPSKCALVVISADVQTKGVRDGIRQWFKTFGLEEGEINRIAITSVFTQAKLIVAPNAYLFRGGSYPDPFFEQGEEEETQPHHIELSDTVPPPVPKRSDKWESRKAERAQQNEPAEPVDVSEEDETDQFDAIELANDDSADTFEEREE